MSAFIIFWWECIKTGAGLGGGLFGFFETGFAVIAAVLLWHTKTSQEKWKIREDKIMKAAAVSAVVSFLVSTLFIAPYLQWKEQRDIVVSFRKDRPKFREDGSGFGYAGLQRILAGTPPPMITMLKFSNTGKHVAKNLTGRIVMADASLLSDPRLIQPIKLGDEYDPGAPLQFNFAASQIPHDAPRILIYVGMDYLDAEVDNARYHQDIFLMWRGSENGASALNFYHMSESDKERMTKYLESRGLLLKENKK